MIDLKDVPVEVTMVDGSRWIIYYRFGEAVGYRYAIEWVIKDIKDGRIKPAEHLDRVQRQLSQINMAYVVSFREPEEDDHA